MAATRTLPFDGADFLRSIVPIALLAVAAVSPPLRLPILIILATGTAIAIRRDAPVRWTWAGAVPVAVSLFWGTLRATTGPDLVDCDNPASPVATWRALEAIVVLVALAVVSLALRAVPASLYLRRPARRWIPWAVGGFLVAGPVALLVGPYLARPFFGDVSYTIMAGALVPALVFAVSNGVMEEVIYRGALLSWSGRVMGIGPALLGQAIVFGLAHSGSDVIGFPTATHVRDGSRRPARRSHHRAHALAAHPDGDPHRPGHPDLLRLRLRLLSRVISM